LQKEADRLEIARLSNNLAGLVQQVRPDDINQRLGQLERSCSALMARGQPVDSSFYRNTQQQSPAARFYPDVQSQNQTMGTPHAAQGAVYSTPGFNSAPLHPAQGQIPQVPFGQFQGQQGQPYQGQMMPQVQQSQCQLPQMGQGQMMPQAQQSQCQLPQMGQGQLPQGQQIQGQVSQQGQMPQVHPSQGQMNQQGHQIQGPVQQQGQMPQIHQSQGQMPQMNQGQMNQQGQMPQIHQSQGQIPQMNQGQMPQIHQSQGQMPPMNQGQMNQQGQMPQASQGQYQMPQGQYNVGYSQVPSEFHDGRWSRGDEDIAALVQETRAAQGIPI
jgi:hypothetical protein